MKSMLKAIEANTVGVPCAICSHPVEVDTVKTSKGDEIWFECNNIQCPAFAEPDFQGLEPKYSDTYDSQQTN